MLNSSLINIPLVGEKTEMDLWNQGFTTLRKIANAPVSDFSTKRKKIIQAYARKNLQKLKEKDINYFYETLPTKEHWRIFKDFQDSIAYLDIETTGLSDRDKITTIVLYDGEKIKHYVNGKNLNEFKKDIIKYKLLVTFNGKSFDIPFIEKYFGILVSNAHIDLRYVLFSLGYTGGLKLCEKKFGIKRACVLGDIDGFFSVLLWKYYKKYNNNNCLNTLLSYNTEDVLSLEYLLIKSYNLKILSLSSNIAPIKIKKKPDNPFKSNKLIVNRIKKGYIKYGTTYLEKNQIKLGEKIKPDRNSYINISVAKKPSIIEKYPWLFAENNETRYPEPTENSGKLLIFVKSSEVDQAWEKVRTLTLMGLLTKYVKVSTLFRRKIANKKSHVICVYTYDYTDRKDILRVRNILKSYGFGEDIPYKTDEDTRKGKIANKVNS